ncbi:MAG: methylated-DNA--[protein]-cysteine S-methyltransferase [Clostridium sp.]
MIVYDYIETQIGKIYVVMNEFGLTRVEVIESMWEEFLNKNETIKRDKVFCAEAIKQLDEYFKGKRKIFELPIVVEGTEFRKKVWNALMEIPYGETKSYGDIAKIIDNEKAVRAIGQANKSNLFPIIIPCHRVIGKNNKLRGYAGHNIGVQLKLIEHEKIYK